MRWCARAHDDAAQPLPRSTLRVPVPIARRLRVPTPTASLPYVPTPNSSLLYVRQDKYLDYAPFQASWRVKEGAQVVATPLVGCRQRGSHAGFGYARLRVGESLPPSGGEGVDFHATDAISGQRLWTECAGVGSRIYERTRNAGPASAQSFAFGAANGGGGTAGAPQFSFGGGGGGMAAFATPPAGGAMGVD